MLTTSAFMEEKRKWRFVFDMANKKKLAKEQESAPGEQEFTDNTFAAAEETWTA